MFKEAIEQYDISINLNCEIRDLYNNPYYQKFLILNDLNFSDDIDEIIRLLNILLKTFPTDGKILHHLLEVYDKKKDYKNCIITATQLVNFFSSNTDHLILRAKYELKLEHKANALNDLERAVNINGNIRKDIANDGDFDSLREEERFKNLIKF